MAFAAGNSRAPHGQTNRLLATIGGYKTLPTNLPPTPRQPQGAGGGHGEEGVGRGFGYAGNTKTTPFSNEGSPKPRFKASKRTTKPSQMPPRSARSSDELLLLPSNAVSFHSHILPPWPIVP